MVTASSVQRGPLNWNHLFNPELIYPLLVILVLMLPTFVDKIKPLLVIGRKNLYFSGI